MHMHYAGHPAAMPESGHAIHSRRPDLRARLAALAALALLGCATTATWAQPVSLGAAADFSVVAASAITNTGPTILTGDLGISPNDASSVTGFTFSTPPGPGTLIGTAHFADAVALAAQNAVTTAYNELAALPCGTVISADLGGMTLTPGVYCSGSSMGLTGTVTLDAQGDPDAAFVFQIGSTLTTASNAIVSVINGGQSCNVFWQIGSSATLGTGTAFIGSMLALETITLTTGSLADGRVLARTGAVTLDSSTVSVCSLLVVGDGPTLTKAFSPSTIEEDGLSTLTITLGNPESTDATLTEDLIDTLPAGVVIAPAPDVATTCLGTGAPQVVAGGSTVTLPAGRIIPANGSCTVSVDVTAAEAGTYVNTIPADALVTSIGNNSEPAVATLTVVPFGLVGPTISKAFSPSTIEADAISTLTITLGNPDLTDATLTEDLIDTLPAGVVIAPAPNLATTCLGTGAPQAAPGGSTVTLPAGRIIPANGSCTLSVDVTAAAAGTYVNTLPVGALVTSNGSNMAPAIATLTVLILLGASIPIPTLSQWAAILLGALLLVFGTKKMRRRLR